MSISLRNENGFSLVGVMIAAGLMGGLSLAFMQIMKNVNTGQTQAKSVADELELRTEMRMLLDSKDFCTASLKGKSFYKKNMDEPNKLAEGLDVQLYFADQDGNRSKKRFSATDSDYSQYGKLKISSMKLYLTNGTGSNYAPSNNHSDIGELRVKIEKPMPNGKTREMPINIPLTVTMKTIGGLSFITSCTRETLPYQENLSYPNACAIELHHQNGGDPKQKTRIELKSGGFVGINLDGDTDGNDKLGLGGACNTSGDELTKYMRGCRLSLGHRDNTVMQKTPSSSRISNLSDGIINWLSLSGDVGDDDTLYFKFQCPETGDPKFFNHLSETCMLCLGHADEWRPTPDNVSCKKVTSTTDTSWGILRLNGDVGADDALFVGFFCNNEYYPFIKNVQY